MFQKLRSPAFSVLCFGVYLLGQGLALFLFPTFLLGLFQIPTPLDVWVRVVGIALLVLGLYYTLASRANLTTFFRFTTYGRTLQFFLFLILYTIAPLPLMLLGFSFLELLSGLWTYWALQQKT